MIYITKNDRIKQSYKIDKVFCGNSVKWIANKDDIIVYSEDDILPIIEKYFKGNKYKKLSFGDTIDKVIYYFNFSGDKFYLMKKIEYKLMEV